MKDSRLLKINLIMELMVLHICAEFCSGDGWEAFKAWAEEKTPSPADLQKVVKHASKTASIMAVTPNVPDVIVQYAQIEHERYSN